MNYDVSFANSLNDLAVAWRKSANMKIPNAIWNIATNSKTMPASVARKVRGRQAIFFLRYSTAKKCDSSLYRDIIRPYTVWRNDMGGLNPDEVLEMAEKLFS